MSIIIFNTYDHRTIIDMKPLLSRVVDGNIQKQCSGCLIFKTLENFHKDKRKNKYSFQVSSRCKSCYIGIKAEWRERFKERNRLQRMSSDEKEKKNERERRKYKNNPNYRLERRLRTRVYKMIRKGTRSVRTQELLGADYLTIKNHLESQFKPGMTWESRDWHIDHRRPCASFDLTKESEQRICFHYTNLQPLWAKENFSKGKKEPPR